MRGKGGRAGLTHSRLPSDAAAVGVFATYAKYTGPGDKLLLDFNEKDEPAAGLFVPFRWVSAPWTSPFASQRRSCADPDFACAAAGWA